MRRHPARHLKNGTRTGGDLDQDRRDRGETAARLVSGAYDRGQENKGRVKRDLQVGEQRGQELAEHGKQKAQEKVDHAPQTAGRPPAGALRADPA